MSAQQWGVVAVVLVGVAGLAALGWLAWWVARSHNRIVAELAETRSEVEALRARLSAAERRHDRPGQEQREYTITQLGELDAREGQHAGQTVPERAPVLPAPLFTDLVLREAGVQAASWTAGLRRALAPETRNRIRFHVRREVKRARKQRRVELRRARRELSARQRLAVDPDGAGPVSAGPADAGDTAA